MSKQKQITIGKKLIASFLVISAITFIVGAMGFYGSHQSAKAITEIGAVRLPSVQSLLTIQIAVKTIGRANEELFSPIIATETRAEVHRAVTEARKLAQQSWTVYESLAQTPEEAAEWKRFVPLWESWLKAHNAFIETERAFANFNVVNPVALQRELARFRAAHSDLRSLLRDHVVEGVPMSGGDDPTACGYGKWLAAFKTDNAKLGEFFEQTKPFHKKTHELVGLTKTMAARGDIEGARKIVHGEFRETVLQTVTLFDEAQKMVDEGNQLLEKMGESMGQVDTTGKTMEQSLSKLVDINNKVVADTLRDNNAQVNTLKLLNLTVTLIGVILALVLGIVISRNITRPIYLATEMMKDISEGEGDLTKRLEVVSRDEIGDMALYFNRFVEKLQGIIGRISGNAQTVASSATELSAVSAQTAQSVRMLSEKTATSAAAAEESSANTVSVAASIEQASTNLSSVAGATEEMSATIGEIAASSEKARAISTEAAEQAASVSSLMQQLGEAAREIGKVTETITDISSQTNLLALNATIEAARAGAAGKGFAVVANEIKELAKQTATATEDIKAKIGGVQSSAGDAISDIEKITRVIKEVGHLVASIATAIEQQATVTKDVAINIAQASAGVQDANERVAQTASVSASMARDIADVDAAAGEIRSGGDQVRASAEELSLLAEQLKSLVGQFQI